MDIPSSAKGIFGYTVLYAFILFFVAVAVFNVIFSYESLGTLILSVIWIAIVIMVHLNSYIEEGGIRYYVLNRGGQFARRQFAEVAKDNSGRMIVCFGYVLFSRHFYLLKVRGDGIKTIDWGPGQAASMTGKDMNDWHVALWFNPDCAIWNRKTHKLGIYIIGLHGPKDQTETFGNAFIDFLRNAGMSFGPIDRVNTDDIIGKTGITSSPLEPIGKIIVEADEYPAHSRRGYVYKGEKAKIIEKRGLSLHVEQVGGIPYDYRKYKKN